MKRIAQSNYIQILEQNFAIFAWSTLKKKVASDLGSLLVIKVYLISNWTAVQSYKYKYPLNFSLWSQLIPSYEATF